MAFWDNLFSKKQADKHFVSKPDFKYFFDHGLAQGYRLHQQYHKHKPTSYDKKLELILESPAAFFVFDLMADLFSLGEFRLYPSEDPNAQPIDSHPILDLLNSPNPLQSATQFKYDYMFWRKIGTANMVADSEILSPNSKLYWLKPQYIRWPDWFNENKDTLFFSDDSLADLGDREIEYRTESQRLMIPWKRIRQFHDISNGIVSNWESPSRVNAIYKVIINSDLLTNSKATTSDFAGKYIVGSEEEFGNVEAAILDDDELDGLRRMAHSNNSVFAMSARTQVNPMLANDGKLKSIDESWMSDAYKVGKILKIPKDVMEILGTGSTYENQEKARAAVMYYACQPEGNDMGQGILDFYDRTMGYRAAGMSLRYEVNHLPFVQAFMKDESEVKQKLSTAFKNFVQSGADQQQTADYLGIDIEDFQEINRSNGQGADQEGLDGTQGSQDGGSNEGGGD